MNFNLNVYEGSASPSPTSTARTKQLRVTFSNQSGPQVSGPFTEAELNDVLRSFALRAEVVKIEVEDV